MNHTVFIILESTLFVTALSTDALIASLAYGSNKIKIPYVSVMVIALLCTGILGISLLVGTFLKPFLPTELLKGISFAILFFIGIMKLLDNIIKALIDKYTLINKQIKFSMLNLNFILNIYADPKEADIDESKVLSPREALSLGIALSIDSLAAGVGAALGNVNIIAVILASLLLSTAAIKCGEILGNKLSEKVPFKLSWLSGFILIALAIVRVV